MKWPVVAVVFSLFCSGLGHLYCGRLVRAVLFFLAPLAITFAIAGLSTLAPLESFPVLVFALVLLGFLLYVYAIIDAYFVARATPADAPRHGWKNPFVYALVLVAGFVDPLLSAAFLRAEVLEAFKIPTASMAPALVPGDRILVTKWTWTPEDVQKGDVVVFRGTDGRGVHYVKRVAGLPGETVERRDGTEETVPADHVWVLGDNTDGARVMGKHLG